ncbi:MAG: thymidine phosphorylase [Vampirovibrionales bacterium]|nr:thymidine phosphorylase [Vampirovibrionales bacterium]
MMRMIEIIDKKRRGEAHTKAEIDWLVETLMAGVIPDYQLSAWLMAVCCRGLDLDETTWLTDAYVRSGSVLDLSSIDGVVVDKHSTGGVGDKTTLVLIPLLAAAGVNVVKLSGRGLGYTGGTVDKLEAIAGFQVALENQALIDQIKRIGVAISSQTKDLAPADGLIYALRDVTATVQSIPLIAASVVSKKIATGAKVIVLDIKYGSGAFMQTLEDARALAETCREIGRRLNRVISTVISGMDQPLGFAIGHTLEVVETIETLKGKGPADLEKLSLVLGAVALVGAGVCDNLKNAEERLLLHLHNGSALKKFEELLAAQHGDVGILSDPTRMPQAKALLDIPASQSGYIATVDAMTIAKAAKILGAGRSTKADVLDLGVGVVLHKKVGDKVTAGETLCTLYASAQGVEEAKILASQAFTYGDNLPTNPALVEQIDL